MSQRGRNYSIFQSSHVQIHSNRMCKVYFEGTTPYQHSKEQFLTDSCFPSGLSIDFPAGKMYWLSSSNGTINRCNLDGSGFEVIESMKRDLTKATALAVMGK